MKASFRHIFAALAATAALAACTKETTPPDFENDKVNPAAEGSRVIAVSFAPQTKTALSEDGLQPVFVHGDKILVANGQDEPDTCKVSVKDGKATISTKLTGPLTAVYPAKAAGMNSGNPKQIDTVLVSTVQSGTFADANICMAKMKDENDESLSFDNKTALFEITPPEGVTSFTIKSLNTIDATTGQRSTTPNAVVINTEEATDEARRVITVTVPDDGTAYVSLVPGVKLSDLSFDAGDSYGTKQISIAAITASGASDVTAPNTKYIINSTGWETPEYRMNPAEMEDENVF